MYLAVFLRIRHSHSRGLKCSSRACHSICWFFSCCGLHGTPWTGNLCACKCFHPFSGQSSLKESLVIGKKGYLFARDVSWSLPAWCPFAGGWSSAGLWPLGSSPISRLVPGPSRINCDKARQPLSTIARCGVRVLSLTLFRPTVVRATYAENRPHVG